MDAEGLPALNSETLLAWLDAYERGMSSFKTVLLFQYLIDNRIVWGMGHEYVAMAEFLIIMGYCLLPESEATFAPYCTLKRRVEQ